MIWAIAGVMFVVNFVEILLSRKIPVFSEFLCSSFSSLYAQMIIDFLKSFEIPIAEETNFNLGIPLHKFLCHLSEIF